MFTVILMAIFTFNVTPIYSSLTQQRIIENLEHMNLVNPQQLKYILRMQKKDDSAVMELIGDNVSESISKIHDNEKLEKIDEAVNVFLSEMLDKNLYWEDQFANHYAMRAFAKYTYQYIPNKSVVLDFESHTLDFTVDFAFSKYGDVNSQKFTPQHNFDFLKHAIQTAFQDSDVNIFITPLRITLEKDNYAGVLHWVTLAVDRKKCWIIDSTIREYPVFIKTLATLLNDAETIWEYESFSTKQQGNNELCGFFTMFYIMKILTSNSIEGGIKEFAELGSDYVRIGNLVQIMKNDFIRKLAINSRYQSQ